MKAAGLYGSLPSVKAHPLLRAEKQWGARACALQVSVFSTVCLQSKHTGAEPPIEACSHLPDANTQWGSQLLGKNIVIQCDSHLKGISFQQTSFPCHGLYHLLIVH